MLVELFDAVFAVVNLFRIDSVGSVLAVATHRLLQTTSETVNLRIVRPEPFQTYQELALLSFFPHWPRILSLSVALLGAQLVSSSTH